MQRHVIGCSLVIVFVAFLRAGFAADVSQEDQAKLSSLQQKIDELDHAGKYREAIPVAEEHLKLVEKSGSRRGRDCGQLQQVRPTVSKEWRLMPKRNPVPSARARYPRKALWS